MSTQVIWAAVRRDGRVALTTVSSDRPIAQRKLEKLFAKAGPRWSIDDYKVHRITIELSRRPPPPEPEERSAE